MFGYVTSCRRSWLPQAFCREGEKLCSSVAEILPIGFGKSIQKRLHCCRCALDACRRELVGVRDLRLAYSQSFIRSEEEKLAFEYRPAQHPAEIVLPQLGPLQTRVIRKPVVGIHHVVAEVFECGAAKIIAA